jgi:hypothetical protein
VVKERRKPKSGTVELMELLKRLAERQKAADDFHDPPRVIFPKPMEGPFGSFKGLLE